MSLPFMTCFLPLDFVTSWVVHIHFIPCIPLATYVKNTTTMSCNNQFLGVNSHVALCLANIPRSHTAPAPKDISTVSNGNLTMLTTTRRRAQSPAGGAAAGPGGDQGPALSARRAKTKRCALPTMSQPCPTLRQSPASAPPATPQTTRKIATWSINNSESHQQCTRAILCAGHDQFQASKAAHTGRVPAPASLLSRPPHEPHIFGS